MDNIPSLPPPQPLNQLSTPQIRSRITVVCAECKRLKLKCDRRVPCGSCTKRDTVPRCIYSPAAAEKVDLHSLNNRLMQVEATLSLITSGQTPPVFQSSYPFSQIPSTNLSTRSSSSSSGRPSPSRLGPQHHSQHHLAPPGTTNTFISVSPQVLASVWLDELERDNSPPLELKLPLSSSYALNELNPIKLEAAPDPELPYSSTSGTSLSLQSQNKEIHAARHLPTPDIYYPFYSSSGSQVQPPHASSSSHVPLQIPRPDGETVGKPCVTPALVALLPPLSRAKQLLQSAAHLFSIRPFPLPACLLSSLSDESGEGGRGDRKGKGKARCPSLATRWDAFECRALCLIGSRGLGARTTSTKSDRKARENLGARAREIFFGSGASTSVVMESLARRHAGGGGAKSESTKPDVEAERELVDPGHTAKDRGESLPFFAVVCMVLAMGAATSEGHEDGERWSPAAASVQSAGRERHETSELFRALAQQSLDVWEKSMAYVSPPVSKETSKIEAVSEEEKLDFLIANLLVIGYQLFKSDLRIDVKDSEQARIADLNRLLPLVAKIVNMARVFGLEKAQSSSPFKDEEHGMGKSNLKEDLNDKKRGKSEERRRRKDDLKRMIWWDIVSYELFISDALGHPSLLSISSSAVKLPRCAGPSSPADEADSDQDEDEENLGSEGSNDIVEAYHGACYRLTKITQVVKYKMMYPDCCCGYTLDQAAFLEGEIRYFLQSMPPPLRFAVMDDKFKDDASPPPEAGDLPNRSILRMQRCALTIMAQRLIIMVYLPFLHRHPTSWRSPMSSLSDSYAQPGDSGRGNTWNPVLEPIFRAARCIIQASLLLGSCNVSQSNPRQVPPLLLGLYPVEKALLDAVTICTYTTTLHAVMTPGCQAADSALSGMRMLWDSKLGSECEALLQRLKKRFRITPDYSSTHGVKRKHEKIVMQTAGSYDADLSKNGGEPPTNHLRVQMTMQKQRITNDTSATGVQIGNTLPMGRDPETGQKGKKHAKKSHYPSVGIRVRQGKETPPFLRPKIGSPSISTPTTRVDDKTSHRQGHRQGFELQSSNQPLPSSKHVPNTPTSVDRDLRHQSLSHDSPPVAPFITQLKDGSDRTRTNDVVHLESYNGGYQQQDVHVNPITLPRPYEGDEEHEQQSASFSPAYLQGVTPVTVESSPYGSSGHATPASGSPYAASGNIVTVSTPSLGQAPQAIVSHPSALPAYAHAYYHMGQNDGFSANAYNQTHGQENVSYTGVRLDTAGEPSPSVGNPTGGLGMAATVPSPPVYEKTRSAIFDIKPPMDVLVQQQMHRQHMLQHQTTYGVDQHERHSIQITESAWPPQPPVPMDGSQRFWTPPVEEFKYFRS